MNNNDIEILQKILELIAQIEKFIKDVTLNEFLENDEKQNAVCMSLLNIGELISKKLSLEFKNSKNGKAMPLKQAMGLRNVIAHEYFVLHFETIWKTITTDIPVLKNKIERLLK